MEGGERFFAEGNLPGKFNKAHFCNQWERLITHADGAILGVFDDEGNILGALGYAIAPDFFTGQSVATELLWYVLPEHRGYGLALLEAFERHARQRGAKFVGMTHLMSLQPEKLGAFYERCGYKCIEHHYMKEL